jgi:hypothetical protein
MQLLRMFEQTPTIQVFLMDGSSQQLSLVSSANTTVQQLHQQMIKVVIFFVGLKQASLLF